ncbi:N-acetylgalactosaminyltransferase 4-like [Drosophila obscura]|uniref:N-acetylgalactosaminyltransferase 4-like n=1 Tax=Drosophila obscura TaxID=7282 RepID=UPI001BB24C07|nr:N-acetylgalactosaminyltransferase 4-like [Drosophila obscura]
MKINLDLKKLVAMLLAIITVSLISTILLGKSIHTQNFDTTVADEDTETFVMGQTDLDVLKVERRYDFGLPLQGGPRRDWHDRVAMEADNAKNGLGEQGLSASNEDIKENEAVDTESIKYGFNVLLSDKISVNRSISDTRPFQCYSRKYLANLPNVSVIMVFHNTHLSVLLRSIHSIINRTPHELLHEIILVDDGSTDHELKQKLDEYVHQHMSNKVSVKRQPVRTGVAAARVAGVTSATGSVVVFCDALIEVIYNWLPPLIEPIVIHYKIVTSPILDKIDNMNFSFKRSDPMLWRGGFNWHLAFNQLPVLPEDNKGESQPYRNPVMEGTVFAISRKYFWELGGYDEGLDAGGGEQYEMSFKIWMCGGMLLQVPCSRVAHIVMAHKGPTDTLQRQPVKSIQQELDNLARNYKRVAEVWMDGYRHYLYSHDPNRYHISAGNVTHQKEIRQKLGCKSFDWYMHEVAPDFLERFPLVEPRGYGSGAIQSVAYPGFCVDALAEGFRKPVGMRQCSANLTHPQPTQFWRLTRELEIVCVDNLNCLQVRGVAPNATVWLQHCHKGDNQVWYYSSHSKWLQQSSKMNRCLEAFIDGSKAFVRVNHCFPESKSQRWQIGWTNRYMDTMFRTNSTMKKRMLSIF